MIIGLILIAISYITIFVMGFYAGMEYQKLKKLKHLIDAKRNNGLINKG
jgi:hypothetical protein